MKITCGRTVPRGFLELSRRNVTLRRVMEGTVIVKSLPSTLKKSWQIITHTGHVMHDIACRLTKTNKKHNKQSDEHHTAAERLQCNPLPASDIDFCPRYKCPPTQCGLFSLAWIRTFHLSATISKNFPPSSCCISDYRFSHPPQGPPLKRLTPKTCFICIS